LPGLLWGILIGLTPHIRVPGSLGGGDLRPKPEELLAAETGDHDLLQIDGRQSRLAEGGIGEEAFLLVEVRAVLIIGPHHKRLHAGTGGQSAVVIVGDFRNRTLEHIPVNTFVRDLERAFIQSGAVRVVASATERRDVRDERVDQQEHARADTRARMAQEQGAQYMLQGTIEAIEDQEGRERVVYYQIDATLVDLESNLKVWTGQHRIKKYIAQPRSESPKFDAIQTFIEKNPVWWKQ
jgi:hypothetical protein